MNNLKNKMSYRRPKIQSIKPKNKKIEITHHEVKEIKNNEPEEIEEYNEDNLNEVIKAF